VETPVTGVPSHVGLRIDNKYLLEAELGSGGMGTVYRAARLLIGDSVAIKILHPGHVDGRNSVERFRREAQAAARLKHPNVVPIYDFGVSSEGLVYLVMELVEGKTLRDMLREDGSLDAKKAAEITTQVCSALEAAHQKNIIHRDIKPDNIVVDATGDGLRVKVLDFGIAWMRDVAAASLTETGNVVGTPHYMSPEQCLGEEPDPRSDIYSMGVVLFEMLAGVVPFNSRASTAVVIQHVNERPPSLRAIKSSVPPAVESVVTHALAKRREQRPQSAALLAAELAAAIGGHVARASHANSSADAATTEKMPLPDWSGGRQRSVSPSTPGRIKKWIGATAGIALIAAVVWLATRSPEHDPSSRLQSATTTGSAPRTDTASSTTTTPSNAGGSLVWSGVDSPRVAEGAEGDFAVQSNGSRSPSGDPTPQVPAQRQISSPPVAGRKTAVPGVVANEPKTSGISSRTARKDSDPRPAAPRDAITQNIAAPRPTVPTVTADQPARIAVEKNPATKDPAPVDIPAPKPNLATAANEAALSCVDALRSKNVGRIAQLYPDNPQDKENREKLLARMRDAASRLTVAGPPVLGPPQIDENSGYSDFVVRLSWRGNFGQTVNKETKFRATIARTESDSHISCRIIGKAAL
jgi:serine/threonine protein kinase